jgi:DNA-binding SARP family transcriptional activator
LKGLDPEEPSDIWGLGILAWETLTGRGPFDAESLSATLEASRTGAIPSIGEEVEELSSEEVEILDRCLSRCPEDRPSARAVVRVLRTTFDPVAYAAGLRARSDPEPSEAAPRTEARILLRALGSLELECRGGSDVEAVLRQPKRMALLVLLAHGGTAARIRRDSLIGLLWPDSDQARGRHALRQSLYFIRSALGADLFAEGCEAEVGIREGVLACDVSEFTRHARGGRPDAAMSWYRGDLLPGFFLNGAVEFERWLETERIALRRMASSCCWELSDRHASAGDDAEAGAWARRAADYTPFDEAALQRLIRQLDRLGDRAGALKAFEHFAHRMAEEYAAQPSPETKALVASVRARG